MPKQSSKINIPICLACLLLCLTLFSLHFSGGLYAKYITKGSGGDGARVARFEITEENTEFTTALAIETIPGEDVTKQISVTNKSEVAVGYTITIKNRTKNIPFAFSVDGSSPALGQCSVTRYLEPNSTRAIIPIVAKWESNESAVDYMGMVDLIDITIEATQVD